jgi:hypothetical protein
VLRAYKDQSELLVQLAFKDPRESQELQALKEKPAHLDQLARLEKLGLSA